LKGEDLIKAIIASKQHPISTKELINAQEIAETKVLHIQSRNTVEI
jgi:hypothetical protein